jgi:hypothetical protein
MRSVETPGSERQQVLLGLFARTSSASDAASRSLGWPVIALQAAAMWLATRVALLLFTYFAPLFLAGLTHHASQPLPPRTLLLQWQRWDALWYIGIAQHGYVTAQATAFFPLYPLLIRAMTLVIGTHWITASLLVANLGALGGFVGIGLLAAHELGTEDAAWPAIRVMAAYPLAFFLAAPYTEGLFLAAASFSLLAMRRGRWPWATACAALALLTRPTGLILVLPLLWEFGAQHGWWQRAAWRWGTWRERGRLLSLARAGLIVASIAAAGGLYMLFLWHQFGDGLLFLHAEHHYWRHQPIVAVAAHPQPAAPQAIQAMAWTYDQARSLVDLGPVLIFGALTVAGMRRLPVSLTLYMLALLALIVSSPRPDRLGFFVSAGRYLIAAVPAFLLLGRWAARRPWLDILLVSAGFLMQAVFALFFLAGGWMV